MNHLGFTWYDYGIFVGMLAVSSAIGIYFGCFGSKQSTAGEYLMGGKKMQVFPIAMSLVASHISGITLLSVPADVYRYGAGYWLSMVSFLVIILPTAYIYLPVFFDLKITSIYEYLHRRFDEKTRLFSSFLFALAQFLFLPIVIYIPALAFSAASGINLHWVTPIVCGVCIFYTTIGGLKAVVWTDTLQFTVTLGATAAVLVIGIRATGGLGNVWTKSIEGHRLDILDFEFGITKRDDFWAFLIGYTAHWLALSNTNQGCVQKFLSVSTLKEARIVAVCNSIGLGLVKTASVITGLAIYARYADCDPFSTRQIHKNDQLLPYYVMDVTGSIPGLSGLFIAGVFSAGLSTLSAHLNCLSGTIYEDFLVKCLPKDISEKAKSSVLKLIVLVAGIICTLLVFVFEHLGGVLPLSIAFNGATNGPLLGMFTLGVLSRRTNSKGAFYGGVAGLVGILCLSMPATYFKMIGWLKYPLKPISTAGCNASLSFFTNNNTILFKNLEQQHEWVDMFKISHYYYSLIACLLTIGIGLLISYFTDADEREVSEELLSPIIRKTRNEDRSDEYRSVDVALKFVEHGNKE